MIKDAIKKWLNKKGYTIIKTKPEEINRMIPPELPASFFSNCKTCSNRYEVLDYLPKGGTIAEVGVAYGNFSEVLLEKLQPEKFIAIDSFAFTADNEPWQQTIIRDNKITHLDFYKNKFASEIATGRMEVYPGFSWEMLATLPDNSLDYLYLDAGHTYDEVVKDIAQVKTKMKTSGIIQFNDYTLFDTISLVPYGVPKAVNEFMIQENYEMIFFCLHRQFFCDVVVRRRAEV